MRPAGGVVAVPPAGGYGGQRQLISFARALLMDPRLLILDEATSSVDPQTERVIPAALQRRLKGRTAFVIMPGDFLTTDYTDFACTGYLSV